MTTKVIEIQKELHTIQSNQPNQPNQSMARSYPLSLKNERKTF
jgi:hypothetical protein